MIRILFDADLKVYEPQKLNALVGALVKGGLKPDVILHDGNNKGKVTFVLRNTEMQAYDLITLRMPNAKHYAICGGCNSIHFKTEHTYKELFRCPCGTYVNKPIKQK